MLDWLRELIVNGWHRLSPLEIVVVSQNAGLLRFGKYVRTLEPGLHWKWPIVDELNTQDVTLTTMRMEPQTLTTKDRKVVTAAVVVKYRIKDVEPYICEITDQKDVLADVTMGAVLAAVNERTLEELIGEPPADAIRKQVANEVNRYGFKVEKVTFTDLAEVFTVRLIQPREANLEN